MEMLPRSRALILTFRELSKRGSSPRNEDERGLYRPAEHDHDHGTPFFSVLSFLPLSFKFRRWWAGFILYPFTFILEKGVAVISVRATTDHEHDHSGFPESETRTRLLSPSALIIHPVLTRRSPCRF
jgi:hypothetical protein